METTNIILSSQVAGTIEKIVQKEGNRVGAGDTLIIIDSETYLLQLNQAEANYQSAKTNFDRIESLFNNHRLQKKQYNLHC